MRFPLSPEAVLFLTHRTPASCLYLFNLFELTLPFSCSWNRPESSPCCYSMLTESVDCLACCNYLTTLLYSVSVHRRLKASQDTGTGGKGNQGKVGLGTRGH